MEVKISTEIFEHFLDALVEGRKAVCRDIVCSLLDRKIRPVTLYVELFSKALYEVGVRWESGRLSVAVEHMATATVEDLLGMVFAQQSLSTSPGRKAVVFCGTDELHQVGGRMVADTLEGMGWDVAFLGANTPVVDLVPFVGQTNPELVAISVTLERHIDLAIEILSTLRQRHPQVILLAGGQAVWRQRHRLAGHAVVVESLYDLKDALE